MFVMKLAGKSWTYEKMICAFNFFKFFGPEEIFSPVSFGYGAEDKIRYERLGINGFEDGAVFPLRVSEWSRIRKFILWQSSTVWRILGYTRVELNIEL